MSEVTRADRAWAHLYPEFRARLHSTLVDVGQETRCAWTLVEGYRSVERQRWLWEGPGAGPAQHWTRL